MDLTPLPPDMRRLVYHKFREICAQAFLRRFPDYSPTTNVVVLERRTPRCTKVFRIDVTPGDSYKVQRLATARGQAVWKYVMDDTSPRWWPSPRPARKSMFAIADMLVTTNWCTVRAVSQVNGMLREHTGKYAAHIVDASKSSHYLCGILTRMATQS